MEALVEHLAQTMAQNNAVLVVGDGIHRELGEETLSDHLAAALSSRMEAKNTDHDFPVVALEFEKQFDRHRLLFVLKEELRDLQPGPIHHLIANILIPGNRVISSRFDNLLELAIEQWPKSYTRIVRDPDLPSFDETKITVIKLLGDIDQPDSMVVTSDDLDDLQHTLPQVNDVVKVLFATKTLVFLGFDLDSIPFKGIFRSVNRDLKRFRRPAYAITTRTPNEVDRRYWREQAVEIHVQEPLVFLQYLAEAVKAQRRKPQVDENPLTAQVRPILPAGPYKALQSFTFGDEAIFNGRTIESQRLTNRILANQMTVLYGESGSGKTSLLHAGAGPRLAAERHMLAVAVPEAGRSLADSLIDALGTAGKSAGLERPPAGLGPGEILKHWYGILDEPIVLVVDQFEQLFVAFGDDEQLEAVHVLQELLEHWSFYLRLVVIVREDFLGRLHVLESFLPGLMNVRFHLDRLGREAARDAIVEPAAKFDLRWEPHLVDDLLDDLGQGNGSGVGPPYLQVVCDELYRHVTARDDQLLGPDGEQFSASLYQHLGGAETILGNYLDQVVDAFDEADRPLVKRLLGALVGTVEIKQRLSVDDLARATDVDVELAEALLDRLTEQRLLQRFGPAKEEAQAGQPQYELTHDVLVPRITGWLGPDFWEAQKTRELVRQAERIWSDPDGGALPSPDLLQLATAHRNELRFSPSERAMLYAAAVGYGIESQVWAEGIEPEHRRQIHEQLLAHQDAVVRSHAALHVGYLADEEAVLDIARLAVSVDEEASVRQAAAEAIALAMNREPAVARPAIDQLVVEANGVGQEATLARRALVTIRDAAPGTQALLTGGLQRSVRRQVLRRRWRRHVHEIRADTIQGVVGGYLAMAFGVGIAAVSAEIIETTRPETIRELLLLALLVYGPLGAFSAGTAAFIGAVLRWLQDADQPWRDWAVISSVAAVSLGFVYAVVSGGQAATQAIGFLMISFVVAGTAALPLRVFWPWRLLLTILASVISLWIAITWHLNIFSDTPEPWGILVFGFMGVGLFIALNPAFWTTASRRVDRDSV